MFFLTGNDSASELILDIDPIFGKEFMPAIRDLLIDNPNALALSEEYVCTRSNIDPSFYYVDVEAGILLLDSNLLPIGGYLSVDLVLMQDHRGKKLGSEIISEFYARFKRLPVWDLDVPSYSPSGLCAHTAAWRNVVKPNFDDNFCERIVHGNSKLDLEVQIAASIRRFTKSAQKKQYFHVN